MRQRLRYLPPELRILVRRAVALFGAVIRRELGRRKFELIERLRSDMAGLRQARSEDVDAVLQRWLKAFRRLDSADRRSICRAFTLMLELMNACENAYREFRLKAQHSEALGFRKKHERGPEGIFFVLTAHPTEARSPENIRIFEWLQDQLVFALRDGFDAHETELRHLLQIAWKAKIARGRKPTVADEAEHVYEMTLREGNLREILRIAASQTGAVYLRSWVGGDKDGHPGVNAETLVESLQLSRALLLKFLRKDLVSLKQVLALVHERRLDCDMGALEKRLQALGQVQPRDGAMILRFEQCLEKFSKHYAELMGALHPSLQEVRGLLKIFPGLVVPLELRETSDMFVAAAHELRTARTNAQQRRYAILGMLSQLKRISEGGDVAWYARGLIISMAEILEHVIAAADCEQKVLGNLRLPIIPLFEQKVALETSPEVVTAMLRTKRIRKAIRQQWNGNLELMIGYSDSAKEQGVLSSRLEISTAILRLDRLCRKERVRPLFFHGSGGSVDRGGGSIGEQLAWWPKSALRMYKATIQGEMVERTFASPEILRSLVEKISSRATQAEKDGNLRFRNTRPGRALKRFADQVGRSYSEKVSSPGFMEIVEKATDYRYLDALKIGSRPAKRALPGGLQSVSGLRAIPWVLCWTQARVLFPTWWGVGSAWKATRNSERAALKVAFRKDPLFSSFVKQLGFTLAKVELNVWRIYLESSSLPEEVWLSTYEEFRVEFEMAVEFVFAISGRRDLLWFRPWMGESIRLRAPMIHPLNLLQVVAFETRDAILIRETVTGIASGMMTTG